MLQFEGQGGGGGWSKDLSTLSGPEAPTALLDLRGLVRSQVQHYVASARQGELATVQLGASEMSHVRNAPAARISAEWVGVFGNSRGPLLPPAAARSKGGGAYGSEADGKKDKGGGFVKVIGVYLVGSATDECRVAEVALDGDTVLLRDPRIKRNGQWCVCLSVSRMTACHSHISASGSATCKTHPFFSAVRAHVLRVAYQACA